MRARAYEHFLPSGPFAILPLVDGGALGHRSSIVWTERAAEVPALTGGGRRRPWPRSSAASASISGAWR